MAQASSVQRDPSMEEILASIRKIIEEGEGVPVRKIAEPQETSPMRPAANDVIRAREEFVGEEPARQQPTQLAYEDQPEFEAALRPSFPLPEQPVQRSAPVEPEPTEIGLRLDAFDDLEAAMSDDTSVANLAFDDLEFDLNDEPAPTYAPARSTIMSASTSRQVTASFGELTDALAASKQRSLEEMAEEMLQPMLQDWLDTHLPSLVERLVRQEIERVVRG